MMIQEEKIIQDRLGKENHFRVPDGYFDTLTDRVMSKLPNDAVVKPMPSRQPMIYRLRPLLYVAACMLVAVLSFAIYFDNQETETSDEPMVAPSASSDSYFDEAADYAMIDNDEIYACLLNE